MAILLKPLITAVAVLAIAPAAVADVLEMPSTPAEQPQESVAHTVPGRGMTMEQVKKRFGQPQEVVPAVGDPPITRWKYNDFIVYFENNLVIHSVMDER
jgi:hypothetical protein